MKINVLTASCTVMLRQINFDFLDLCEFCINLFSFFPEDRTYSCPECGEVFRSKVALRRHQTYVCGRSAALYQAMTRDSGDHIEAESKR